MNFNENLTRKVKIITTTATTTSSSEPTSSVLTSCLLSPYCSLAFATAFLFTNTTGTNVKTKIPTTIQTVTEKVSTASVSTSVGNYNTNNRRKFSSSLFTSCFLPFLATYEFSMPTSPHNKKITHFYCSMGMWRTKVPTRKTFAENKAKISTISEQKQKLLPTPLTTRTAKTKANAKGEVMLPPLTSMSSEQKHILTSRVNIMDKDVETIQVTETIAAAKTLAYNRGEPLLVLPLLQNERQQRKCLPLSTTTTTISKTPAPVLAPSLATPAIYFPILATTAAERTCGKKYLTIKMPFRHLILTIMAVVLSLEFTICTSAILQQQLTTLSLKNDTHLPTVKTNKSANINENLQNLPVTSTTITTLTEATSPSFLSSTTTRLYSSSSSTLLSQTSIDTRPPLQTMQSAALIEKLPATSLLTTAPLNDGSSSVVRSALIGMDTGTTIQTETPALSSLQWEDDENSELSLSTSVLNTYETSDLPPLSEAEQAAKDLLTKGFSIPTYLPPFPVFAVADLPAYLNAVSTTTTESPSNHLRPSDGYDQSSQENLLYFDNLSDHQFSGQQKHHRMLQITRRNSSVSALPNVTVQVGNHAYLPCHIHRLQNKPVSWVRLRDGHIISVDQTTFIADQRFQAIFQDDKEFTWSLQIKYVQPTDEGWYECQASSEPKMSAKVYLQVIVPVTELIGDQSRFVKAGSKVALHCIVRGTLDPPQYIIWYRGKVQIGEGNKMGWYTQLDRNIFGNSGDNQNTIGSLIIPFVRKMDSGNYTCQPSNSASVSVDLHVLSGEYSASAIMSAAVNCTLNDFYLLLLLFLLMLLHKT